MERFLTTCRIDNICDATERCITPYVDVEPASVYTWIPAKALESIGIKREKTVNLVLADGKEVTRSVGFARIRWKNFFTVGDVVFAEEGDPAILGMRTISGFNARVDAELETLVDAGPIPAAHAVEVGDGLRMA